MEKYHNQEGGISTLKPTGSEASGFCLGPLRTDVLWTGRILTSLVGRFPTGGFFCFPRRIGSNGMGCDGFIKNAIK